MPEPDLNRATVRFRENLFRNRTRSLRSLSAWIDRSLFPVLQKIQVLLAPVQAGKSGYLAPCFHEPFFQTLIFRAARLVEHLPRLWHGNLLRDDPGMQGATNIAQAIESISRAHCSARYADKAYHLALEFIETHEVQGGLEHSAEAPVVLGSPQDDTIGLFHLTAQLRHVRRIRALVICSSRKDELVFAQINQPGFGAKILRTSQRYLDSHTRIAAQSHTAGNTGHANQGFVCHRELRYHKRGGPPGLRICIDGSPLLLRSAGVKSYLYYWIRALQREARDRQVVVFPSVGTGLGEIAHERSQLGLFATLTRIAALQATNRTPFPVADWLVREADVFHASNQVRKPPSKPRLTATLHDLTCWLMPELHTPANVSVDYSFAERVLKRAAGMIAVSQSTRADAVRVLGLNPDKIEVIYPGVPLPFFEADAATGRAIAARLGLSKSYILFTGTIEPRKNVEALLDAYQQLSPSTRDEFQLVLTGMQGWGDRDLYHRLRSGIPGVKYLGYVAEADLPGLTAAATLLAYPSLYEGFGFPVAQAMAAGVPVVTSDRSSLPEIAGEAALLVDPASPGEICAAMERLLLSPSLRSELGEKGAARAQQFRWELAAQKSWLFFERVCS